MHMKELNMIGSHFQSAMILFNCNFVFNDNWIVEVDEFEYEFDSYSKLCCFYVGVEENGVPTNAQKEPIF